MSTSIPVLELNTTSFGSTSWREVGKKKRNIPRQQRLDIQRKNTDFYNFVDKTLQSLSKKRLHVKKFTLTDSLDKRKSVSRIDRWISFVIESDVEELSLNFDQGWYCRKYQLPQCVLVAKSIIALTLCQCKLESSCGDINLSSLKKLSLCDIIGDDRIIQKLVVGSPLIEDMRFTNCTLESTSGCDMNFPALKTLSLCKVHADDQIIQKIVAGSPVIEDMSFTSCHGLKSIKFEGLTKAMSIELTYNGDLERVELEAPNLYSLYINQKKQCEINLVSCSNLKMLALSAPSITDKWLHDHLSQLPLIEYLDIHGCHKLERLKISSNSLKTFYMMYSKKDELVEIDIDTPNLRNFAYCGHTVKPFSSTNMALSKAIYQMVQPIAPWNVEKIEFLAKLNNSKLLTLVTQLAKDMVIPQQLRETLPSPSYNVKQLKLQTGNLVIGLDIVELMDSLLWIAPLPEILLIALSIDMEPWMDTICFKFSYEKPILKGKKSSCCKFLPIPCWRHCLKSVMIENFRVLGDEETLKAKEASLEKYFKENAEILETFQFLRSDISALKDL
ncbi:putative F-box protein At1g49610 [Fagus crenata]